MQLQILPRDFKRRASRRILSREARSTTSRRTCPLLVHYHIFKNAGTSFEWTLKQALGRRFCTYDLTAPNQILSSANIIRYVKRRSEIEAVSSHQASFPTPKMRGREVLTSILISYSRSDRSDSFDLRVRTSAGSFYAGHCEGERA